MTTTGGLSAVQMTGTEVMRRFLPASPFVAHLGIELVELGDGHAELALPYRPELATIGSVVHGGALATLIDTAAMAAAWAGTEMPDQLRGATVSMTVTYLAPADGQDVVASARVVRRGHRLVNVQVDVHSTTDGPDRSRTANGQHVTTALVTYQLG